MEVNVTRAHLSGNPIAEAMYDTLQQVDDRLAEAIVFFDFPIYKDLDGDPLYVQVSITSPQHGLIIFGLNDSSRDSVEIHEEFDQVVSYIHSRLIRNEVLRASRLTLKVPVHLGFFSNVADLEGAVDEDITKISNSTQLDAFLQKIEKIPPLEEKIFNELLSTLDGSKGLIKPKKRKVITDNSQKGFFVKMLEEEIALFDKKQRYGFILPTKGPQRIRGIAGSGKTVVLAMKAAMTHLRYPDVDIVYTFQTKSLYQHVRRLITRFFRQFDDKDPDWKKIHVMHGWGGSSNPGVYYNACRRHSVKPLTFGDRKIEATRENTSVFDILCKELKEGTTLEAMYDYVFIDEGQDFPASFIDLCRRITVDERIVWAYDELQNIFDVKVPTQEEVFGKNPDGSPVARIVEDTVLYKSYRNPREILTTAHALGFGIYADNIIQMLEDKGHWNDVGYDVLEGDCIVGQETLVERPLENSSKTISGNYSFSEIVKSKSFANIDAEIEYVFQSIKNDLEEGLDPTDILITVVDDRNIRAYAKKLEDKLDAIDVQVNNTQKDKFGILDFFINNAVTISTIYKAKGNEAYQVYVIGVDALFAMDTISYRNRIFTALTRAKAWASITGVGPNAQKCIDEIGKIEQEFPKLRFIYPSAKDIQVYRRDMTLDARKRQNAERAIDSALKTLSPEEIRGYLEQQK